MAHSYVTLTKQKVKNKMEELNVWKEELIFGINKLVKTAEEVGWRFLDLNSNDRRHYLSEYSVTNASLEKCSLKLMDAISYVNSDIQGDTLEESNIDNSFYESESGDNRSESRASAFTEVASLRRETVASEDCPNKPCLNRNIDCQTASPSKPSPSKEDSSDTTFLSDSTICADSSASSLEVGAVESALDQHANLSLAATDEPALAPELDSSSEKQDTATTVDIPGAADTSISRLNVDSLPFTPRKSSSSVIEGPPPASALQSTGSSSALPFVFPPSVQTTTAQVCQTQNFQFGQSGNGVPFLGSTVSSSHQQQFLPYTPRYSAPTFVGQQQFTVDPIANFYHQHTGQPNQYPSANCLLGAPIQAPMVLMPQVPQAQLPPTVYMLPTARDIHHQQLMYITRPISPFTTTPKTVSAPSSSFLRSATLTPNVVTSAVASPPPNPSVLVQIPSDKRPAKSSSAPPNSVVSTAAKTRDGRSGSVVSDSELGSRKCDRAEASTISVEVGVPEPTPSLLPPGCSVQVARLVVGRNYVGMLTYLESPSSFYLQLCDSQELLDLTEQMSTFYVAQKKGNLITKPKVHLLCALSGSNDVDDQWKRGLICSIDQSGEHKMASVCLIDSGIVVEVPVSSLWELHEKFSRLPSLAIHCSFHGVKPLGGRSWNPTATSNFERLLKFKILNFVVVDVCHSGLHSVEFVEAPAYPNAITSEGICSTMVISKVAAYNPLRTHSSDHTTSTKPTLAVNDEKNVTTSQTEIACKITSDLNVVGDVTADEGAQISPATLRTMDTKPKLKPVEPLKKIEDKIDASKISFKIVTPRSPLVKSKNVAKITKFLSAIPVDTYDDSGEETEFKTVVSRKTKRAKRSSPVSSALTALAHEKKVLLEPFPAAPSTFNQAAGVVEVEVQIGKEEKAIPPKVTAINRFAVPDAGDKINMHDYITVIMVHCYSPDEFYVQPVTEEAATIDDFSKKLAKAYEKSVVPHAFADSSDIIKGSYWCARFKQDKKWYRAKILEVNEESSISPTPCAAPEKQKKKRGKKSIDVGNYFRKWLVHVLYIDYGDKAWVNSCDLRMLKEEFCKIPAFAINCRMAFVSPKPKSALDPAVWDNDALNKLGELTGTNPFTIQRVEAESVDPICVLLWDLSHDPPKILNEDFVACGLAVSTRFKSVSEYSVETLPKSIGTVNPLANMSNADNGFNAINGTPPRQCEDDERSMSMLSQWNPMVDDFNSLANSYKVNVDDAGVALTGYEAHDEKNICLFYQRNQPCPRGPCCQHKHVKPHADGTTTDQKAVLYNRTVLKLPKLGRLVHIEVFAIFHPGRFFANFPQATKTSAGPDNMEFDGCIEEDEDLFTLQEHMQSYYNKMSKRQGDYLLPAKGQIVVAKYSLDNMWYRGRVIDVEPDEQKVNIFYVDYGNSEWVSEHNIRDIVLEFNHLPFQAVECFLAQIDKPSGDATWSKEAKSLFQRLVLGKNLVGRRVYDQGARTAIHLYSMADESNVDIGQALVNAHLARSSLPIMPPPNSKLNKKCNKMDNIWPG